MQTVKSSKYKLSGENTVEVLNGMCYIFTGKEVIVAEDDIGQVDGFSTGDETATVRCHMYNLYGEKTVKEVSGKFYKFTSGIYPFNVVIVPEADIGEVDGFKPTKGGRRRNRRATKRARKSRRSYSRRK